MDCCNVSKRTEYHQDRPIRLADVLLAIGADPKSIAVTGLGYFNELTLEDNGWVVELAHAQWDLRTDDLEQQSDETVAFIASLV